MKGERIGERARRDARAGMDDRGDGRGVVVFDYDRDGDQDVLIAQHEDRALLYRNDGADRNAWLTVQLRGTASNRDGVGARVFLTRAPRERPMLREVSGGNGYLGQSEAVAHFGLGDWTGRLHELRVQWSGGGESILHGVEHQITALRPDRVQAGFRLGHHEQHALRVLRVGDLHEIIVVDSDQVERLQPRGECPSVLAGLEAR